ncbi:MAG: hypothetical protein GJ676_04865 [Rhodobacteraceae bacterium]|nr:hypothetical protein [Paracoccaceae bacterium]
MIRTTLTIFSVLCAAVLATACTRVPEIEAQISPELKKASYPTLQPLDQSVVPLPSPQQAGQEIQDNLNARRDRLKRRAAALETAGVDDESRDRLEQGIDG